MKLHEDQLNLVRHTIRFPATDYSDCLEILGGTAGGDRVKLSYAFRPLTKNGYLAKRNDGSVTVLAKGRTLFPEEGLLISAGGGSAERQRLMAVSRIAALMERNGVPAAAEVPETPEPRFIPSACWRKIAPGILSTTRFVGMLTAYDRRLAVYDIGDGTMEWQSRAEGSLFNTKYGTYETKATGMLRTPAFPGPCPLYIVQSSPARRSPCSVGGWTGRPSLYCPGCHSAICPSAENTSLTVRLHAINQNTPLPCILYSVKR